MNYYKGLLTVILAVALHAGYAQSISIGAKGGLSLTKLEMSSSTEFWARYHLGVFANFRFAKFSLQPEILYSRQGSKDPYTAGEPRVNLEYVSMPVLFKWYIPGGINLQAGPQFSVLARSAFEVESNGSVASIDGQDKFHKFDWAICAGFGWEAPFGLTVDARYNVPITNISKVTNIESYNYVIQISAGYKIFKFGKSL